MSQAEWLTARPISRQTCCLTEGLKNTFDPYDVEYPVGLKHLKVLGEVDLVSRGRVARTRSVYLEAQAFDLIANGLNAVAGGRKSATDSSRPYLHEMNEEQWRKGAAP